MSSLYSLCLYFDLTNTFLLFIPENVKSLQQKIKKKQLFLQKNKKIKNDDVMIIMIKI